ncbi:hypothetical protein JW949_04250 [Candidatus Woesearchaeota archaeon]|nr:hypothetical protein [Candidatus Woesearchaeota archaeon]
MEKNRKSNSESAYFGFVLLIIIIMAFLFFTALGKDIERSEKTGERNIDSNEVMSLAGIIILSLSVFVLIILVVFRFNKETMPLIGKSGFTHVTGHKREHHPSNYNLLKSRVARYMKKKLSREEIEEKMEKDGWERIITDLAIYDIKTKGKTKGKDLEGFIKKHLGKGLKSSRIRSILVNAGWSSKEINKVIIEMHEKRAKKGLR